MYNKLFTKILDSSIWMESMPTRLVWITVLAAMDEDGFVAMASPANLAHRAMVSRDDCDAALKRLEGPDPDSSDPDNDGRRLERVQGGWIVLNAGKYREIATRAMQQEANRRRVQRHRSRKKCNGDVMSSNVYVTISEADAEADTHAERPPSPPCAPPPTGDGDGGDGQDILSLCKKRIKPLNAKAITKAMQQDALIPLVQVFGGNVKPDRVAEWHRDLAGKQVGSIALVFWLAIEEKNPIREPSGFRAGWARLLGLWDDEFKAKMAAFRCFLGIPLESSTVAPPPAPAPDATASPSPTPGSDNPSVSPPGQA